MPKDTNEEIVPPQQANLDPEMRKIVLAGVKFLLARLKQNGLMEPEIEYRDVLLTPALMEKFINGVKENMEIGKDLFVDESGNRVFDLETTLVCGATLGELERLLVYTCASKIFITPKTSKKVEEKEKKKKRFGLFGGKKDKAADKKKADKVNEGADKLAELKPHLIFSWQLPLVEAYNKMRREHYCALGETLLFLDTPKKVCIVAGLNPGEISSVRKLTDERFEKILRMKPQAIAGMSQIKSKSKFDFIFKTAKDRVFDFFAREQQYIAEIIGVHEDFTWALDESVADMSIESLPIMVRLKMPFLKIFMEVFREEFGDFAKIALREPEFAPVYLKPVVEEFVNLMSGDDLDENKEDSVGSIAALKWRGQKEDILKWYKELKQAQKEEADEAAKPAKLAKKAVKA
tara:strand:+ start:8373 stop:9587 length:1215 start_codon:yes stop_codon:yes gene_type:complete